MKRKRIITAAILFAAFILHTLMVLTVGVRPMGCMDTDICLASLNIAVHEAVGVHMTLYNITNVFLVMSYLIIFNYGLIGLIQLIKRRALLKVDPDILALGCFYIMIVIMFVLFEFVVINYRPILLNGEIAASYPSTHTLLLVCVFVSAIYEVNRRLKSDRLKKVLSVVLVLLAALSAIFRFASGVHWLTDITGSLILSGAMLYTFFAVTADMKKA